MPLQFHEQRFGPVDQNRPAFRSHQGPEIARKSAADGRANIACGSRKGAE